MTSIAASETYRAARDLLLSSRTDYGKALEESCSPRCEGRLNWAIDWFDAVARYNNRVAPWIVDENRSGRRRTYGELVRRSDRVATWLTGLGIGKGDYAARKRGRNRGYPLRRRVPRHRLSALTAMKPTLRHRLLWMRTVLCRPSRMDPVARERGPLTAGGVRDDLADNVGRPNGSQWSFQPSMKRRITAMRPRAEVGLPPTACLPGDDPVADLDHHSRKREQR